MTHFTEKQNLKLKALANHKNRMTMIKAVFDNREININLISLSQQQKNLMSRQRKSEVELKRFDEEIKRIDSKEDSILEVIEDAYKKKLEEIKKIGQ